MIDVVLFDIDGTLIDHEAASSRGVIEWSADQGWTCRDQSEALVEQWEAIAERTFPLYRTGQLSFQEQRRQRLREFLPLVGVSTSSWSTEQLDATFEGYLRKYEAAWRAYEDARPSLDRIRGLARLAILSNGDQDQQMQKLRAVDLDGFFEKVMTSSVLGVSKPDARAFALACDAMDVEPDGVLYVGDRLTIDAQPAKAAGLHAALVDRSNCLQHGVPGIQVVGSLEELRLHNG